MAKCGAEQKNRTQMIDWALDQISKEAIWVLVVVGMIVVAAVVSSFRRYGTDTVRLALAQTHQFLAANHNTNLTPPML